MISAWAVATRSAVPVSNTFEAMYANSVDSVMHGTGQETFEAVKMLKSADPSKYKPAAGADYPAGRFGDSLKQLCQLIKANLGVQVAFADIGGWDHHVNEGSTQGQIANVLREFSQSLGAFWIDLGDLAEDTVVVTMSEFGRTARENGNRGTDHGHANVMFVMGGPGKGRQGLRTLARPRSVTTLRRPRSRGDHRLPSRAGRSGGPPSWQSTR